MTKILILGGYGEMGQNISRLLLKNTNVKLLLAGRDTKKLSILANDRVETVYMDIANCEDYIDIFNSVDAVINTTPTIKYQSKLKDVILKSKCDFFDLHSPSKRNYEIFADCKDIKDQTIVLDCGATSFLPFLKLTSLPFEKVNVVSYYNIGKNNHYYTKDTEVEHEEILESNLSGDCVFKNGKWYTESDQLSKEFEFGRGTAMLNNDTKLALSTYKEINEIGYYVIFEIHDNIEEELTCLNINTCNESIKVFHRDGWYLAAVFAVSGIMQYLENKKEGFFYLSEYIDTNKYFSQIENLGLTIQIEQRSLI